MQEKAGTDAEAAPANGNADLPLIPEKTSSRSVVTGVMSQ